MGSLQSVEVGLASYSGSTKIILLFYASVFKFGLAVFSPYRVTRFNYFGVGVCGGGRVVCKQFGYCQDFEIHILTNSALGQSLNFGSFQQREILRKVF